jgi:CRISPR-associated protein Cst2
LGFTDKIYFGGIIMSSKTKTKEKKEIKTIYDIVNREMPFITASFAIHADGAFLNGAGLGTSSENRNVSTVKSYWRNKIQVPYVSSQSWRRWWRNTLIEETSWDESIIEPVMLSDGGSTNKIAGKLDPINYPEDDVFGYMFTKATSTEAKKSTRRLPEVQLVRPSTVKSSILRGIMNLSRVTSDEGFVHLKEGTPLPYTTEFYSAELTASLSFEIYRLGLYVNLGTNNNKEIDPFLVSENIELLDENDHPVIDKAKVYARKELIDYQNQTAGEILKALSKLRGGSKLTQFGVDVAPKYLILAGMNVSGMIFDDLIKEEKNAPILNLKAFKEIIGDYKDKFETPIYLGIRDGYLKNQDDIRNISEHEGIKIIHGTPIEVVNTFVGKHLSSQNQPSN